MPLPQVDPMSEPDTYTGCRGSVNTSITVAPGNDMAIVFCPYSQSPIVTCAYNPSNLFVTTKSMIDNNNWASDITAPNQGGALNFTPSGVGWVGGTDPRTMISGAGGPHYNDYDPLDANPTAERPVRAQFMGGKFSVSISAAYNTVGTVTVLDSKSFPTLLGSKLPASDMYGDRATFVNVPSQSSFLKIYNPQQLLNAVGSVWQSAGHVGSIIGGGPDATIHANGLLPPDGQKWATWSGAFQADGPFGSGYCGNAAAYNWYSCIAQGYPVVLVQSPGGGGPIVINIQAQFSYNVTVPTAGVGAVTVLAQTSPTLEPFSAPVNKIHAVVAPHNSRERSHLHHRVATAVRTSEAGLPVSPDMVTGVDKVVIQTASHVPSVGARLLNGLSAFAHGVMDRAGGVLSDVANVAIDGGLSYLASAAMAAL